MQTTTPQSLDWLWLAGGWTLGVLGVLLLLWSLFRDRGKHKRRCPKCWYDMSGTPGSLTCSECGRTAKRESRLHKARRKWRWALVAMLLLIAAAACHVTNKVKRDGWQSVTPTAALIVLAEPEKLYWNSDNQAVFSSTGIRESINTELTTRAFSDQLRPWEWRWLISRRFAAKPQDLHRLLGIRDRWPRDMPILLQPRLPSLLLMFEDRITVDLHPSNSDDRGGLTEVYTGRPIRLSDPPLGVGIIHVPIRLLLDEHEIWSGEAAVTLVDSARDAMTATDTPEQRQFIRETIEPTYVSDAEAGFRVRSSEWITGQKVCYALQFELLEDGRVVARSKSRHVYSQHPFRGWCGVIPRHERVTFLSVSAAREPLQVTPDMTLRISAAAQTAVLDLWSDSYWDGELLIPVREITRARLE